ncbi:MAG: hypothetical protein Q4B90_05020 [Eubacteriales bacterium]|nr:hypothetical protein [Eubacteriales bacterium]
MRRRKNKWVILTAVGAAILLFGCAEQKREDTTMQEQNNFFEIQREMEQYLTAKYGRIQYKITGMVWRFWNQQYDQMNFETETDGRKEMCWVRRYEKNDQVFFSDSYFGLCIRQEYENKMQKSAEIVFPKAKVVSFLNETEFSQAVEKTDDLKKAKEKGEKIRAVSWIIVTGIEEKELNEKAMQFQKIWEKEQMESLISFFLVETSDFLSFERKDTETFIKDHRYQAQHVCYISE